MTGKRSNLLEDPPTASSSDEDEVEDSIGEGDEIAGNSSSDEEDDSSKTRSVKKPLAATSEKQVSDTESGSDEETDSDSETEKKNPVKTNPVSSSVAKSVIETKDSSVKNQDPKMVKTSEKSTAKRPRETDGGATASTDVKRVKRVSGEEEKKSSGGGEETKKNYFQRLWSEDDEIAVLQGLIDFKTETGVSPYDDTAGFYQMVKKSISFDVTKIQFMEKLRSLKKKYETNLGKAKNGEYPTFLKSHDRKAFDLSKIVWGANGMALESAVKSNGKSKKSSSKSKKVESVKQDCEDEVTNKGDASSLEMDVFLKSVLVKSLARLGVDELAAQQGWSKLASEDKKRFEEQWKALQIREFEFYSQKSGFVHEVVTKMAEAFRSIL